MNIQLSATCFGFFNANKILSFTAMQYTGVGRSRFTVVGMQNTEFILVLFDICLTVHH